MLVTESVEDTKYRSWRNSDEESETLKRQNQIFLNDPIYSIVHLCHEVENRENLVQYYRYFIGQDLKFNTHACMFSLYFKPNRYFLTHPTNDSFHPPVHATIGERGGQFVSVCWSQFTLIFDKNYR